jgi:hypothetical protein
VHPRKEDIFDAFLHKDIVDFLAIVANDILLGNGYRWMLALPGKGAGRHTGWLIVTATIGVNNRQLRLSCWIGHTHFDRYGWRDHAGFSGALTLRHAAIKTHRVARSMNDE